MICFLGFWIFRTPHKMPELCSNMETRNIKSIINVQPFKLTLEFDNGEVKVVDIEERLKAKSTTPDSKYRTLLNPKYFVSVKLQQEWQTIYWDNGIDFCPDVLYSLGRKM